MKKSFTTRALNVKYPKSDPHNALQYPIYESVAFEFNNAEDIAANFRGELAAHAYSRTGNPTVEYFETKLKALSGARNALAVSSGMAAINLTLLALCESGDNIVAWRNLFGHSFALLNTTYKQFGIETRFANFNHIAEIEALIDDRTRVIYFETVTNPQLEIADIESITKLAHEKGIVVVLDSTLTPPVVFDAARYGVDIEVFSTTKFISGGATSVGGAILDHGLYDWNQNPNLAPLTQKFGSDTFYARLKKNVFRNFGSCMTAHTAYFQIIGLDILELRMKQSYYNCLELGDFFDENEKVIQFNYPGHPSCEGIELANKYFEGIPGTIMTFDLESQEACYSFMNRLQIIRRATNLNDNKTLIIHPWSTIYTEFPESERIKMGIRPTQMRLSVGIEGVDDLIEDIRQAIS